MESITKGNVESTENRIVMSIPTFVGLLGVIGTGIFLFGATQSDISTLKRDVSSQSTQIEKLTVKLDELTSLIYRRQARDERQDAKR